MIGEINWTRIKSILMEFFVYPWIDLWNDLDDRERLTVKILLLAVAVFLLAHNLGGRGYQ